MSIQRDCIALRIFECTIIVYFFMEISALHIRNDDPLVREFSRNVAENYDVQGRRIIRDPGQNLPTSFQKISSKIRKHEPESRIRQNISSLPAYPWFTEGVVGYESSSWNDKRRRYHGSDRGSRFNAEKNFLTFDVEPSYWEPIFDGKIIAAIGSLFTKIIKDESNRERLERKKLRETLLLKNFTKMMNDPVQFDILKRESKNAPKYINQVV